MSQSELLFLLLGLGVGVAAGAALLDVLRAHPPRPQVKLTVTHNALPARAAAAVGPGAAGGHRAHVVTPRERIVVPVSRGVDPAYPTAPVAVAAASATRSATDAQASPRAGVATDAGARPVAAASGESPGGGSSSVMLGAADTGPCGDARRVANERCAVAARAREGATAAAEELRRAQRELDDLSTRESGAQSGGNPRAVHEAKDAAQAEFRRTRSRATSPAEVEAAATAWLREIDRINRASRGGSASAAAARRRSSELTVRLESLTIAADAARISAESTALACQTAREALAACEEVAAAPGAQGTGRPVVPPPLPSSGAAKRGGPDGLDVEGHPPIVLRLLQGDRAAMSGVVAALAGDDPEARRTWQLLLTDLVDAILARAIEDCVLDFPEEHEFWGEFSRSQCRDIARALASLGYRFDGLGGFVNGRPPTQRDLSLAVGYAGLESMRVRRWPTESGLAELYRDVVVAADEFLAGQAGNLTLGEMVALLERRAERLAELWNAWGRVRPLLVAPARS